MFKKIAIFFACAVLAVVAVVVDDDDDINVVPNVGGNAIMNQQVFIDFYKKAPEAAALEMLHRFPTLIDAQDEVTMESALMISAKNVNNNMVQALIQYGIDINLQDNDSQTALMIAAENGKNDVVETLVNCPEVKYCRRNGVGYCNTKGRNRNG